MTLFLIFLLLCFYGLVTVTRLRAGSIKGSEIRLSAGSLICNIPDSYRAPTYYRGLWNDSFIVLPITPLFVSARVSGPTNYI